MVSSDERLGKWIASTACDESGKFLLYERTERREVDGDSSKNMTRPGLAVSDDGRSWKHEL